jgi:hypothetical protein
MRQLHLFHRPNVTMPLFTQHIRIRIDCVRVEPFVMLRSPVKVNDFYLPRLGFHHNIQGSQVGVHKPITFKCLDCLPETIEDLTLCFESERRIMRQMQGLSWNAFQTTTKKFPMTRSHKKSLGARFSFARRSCASLLYRFTSLTTTCRGFICTKPGRCKETVRHVCRLRWLYWVHFFIVSA